MEKLDFNRIHKYKQDDLMILIDINSGSLHLIDQLTWDLLDLLEENDWEAAEKALYQKYALEDVRDTINEVKQLIAGGQLFSDDEAVRNYVPHTEPIVKAICLHMAHDCNLRCGYCFADTGAYGGQRSLMSLEVGKKALDFLIKASKHRKHIEVDFFGGEPLLNFEVCKELVKYGREQGKIHDKIFKFTMTTNGVLLTDEVQKFLNDEGISAVLSLDGRPEVNDKMRQFPNGTGSYANIVPKFKHFADSRNGLEYYLRGTYTHWNRDFFEDVKHMVDAGFKEISVEPVVAPKEMSYALTEEDLPILYEQYDKLARHYVEKMEAGEGYNFFHFNVDLSHGPCLPKRLSGCGSGHDYLAISPEGDLYPCHQFVGDKKFKVGTVDEGITNYDICRDFQSSHVLSKPTCMKCWARFYCSGGCHANNLRYGGSLKEPYEYGCNLQKKRLECAIYVQIKRMLMENK